MALSTSIGFPRMGRNRELKRAIESYWQNMISREELDRATSALRKERWLLQQQMEIDLIPSNDFSLYDHVLDIAVMVGAIPERFSWNGREVDIDTYFEMARGGRVHAMEMTKWFDTNYHYIVPEFVRSQEFRLTTTKPVDEFQEAFALGIKTMPVILGPITFLLLGKTKEKNFDVLELLPRLLPVYQDLFRRLEEAGTEWVQIDEPCLALDRTATEIELYEHVYSTLSEHTSLRIFLATYFEGLRENLHAALHLPVSALHLDLVRAPEQLTQLLLSEIPDDKFLSLGVIDGRNVWKNDLEVSFDLLSDAVQKIGKERLIISPSCSMIHVPWDLESETKLKPEIKDWLAFAKQKLKEIHVLTKGINQGRDTVEVELSENRLTLERKSKSALTHNPKVKDRLHRSGSYSLERKSPFPIRKQIQQQHFHLPMFPTTTIGSFPQTVEVRHARADFRKGKFSAEDYEHFLKEEIARCVKLQEDLGLDVLVHGEFERTDMVEYFGEIMDGFLFTQNGWVQSYGTRCVKPPIIYGDVARQHPMTVRWSKYAQSLTKKPMKGMLTGPVTILQWSFVRNDQPKEATCKQIALAIRDEVLDLEKAGIQMIQIDEPALREGLPLRHADRSAYLKWAVESFKLAASGVSDETQIHMHMCYAEFNDIMLAIQAMDADVISIETSRSEMKLLNAFQEFSYRNDVGPGVYDVHSPRVPTMEEMTLLLEKSLEILTPGQIWVNPDCGLKTRGYQETVEALQRMVSVAQMLRSRYQEDSHQ